MKKYIGIDIGGTKCAVVLGDAEGRILKKVRFPTQTDRGAQQAIDRILQAVAAMHPAQAAAIGVSCGGPLDSVQGTILSPPNLPGWDHIEIKRILEERFGRPAYVQNDANACTVAEWKFGAARGKRNVIFLTCGTGMGAGLILDGRLYEGRDGAAGEIGHVRMSELVFAQQVYALAQPGDCLLALSTSGNSKNVVHAVLTARAKGVSTIGLTGEGGGRLAALCDACICVPAHETFQVQEYHLPVYHTLCAMLEQRFFGKEALP